MIKALFFDFDGLILDTETPEVLAWQKIFDSYGLEYPEHVWQNIVGRGPDQVAEQPAAMLKRLAQLDATEEQLHDHMREEYFKILDVKPLPGVTELIEGTPVPKFIVSSSDRKWVSNHLRTLGLTDYFIDLFTRDLVQNTKPAPDLYLLALSNTSLEPNEVWAIEDSENGLKAATSAGIQTIVCPNPTTKHLDFSLATHVATSLEEISWDWLQANSR